jgi:glutaredoxin
LCFSARLFTAPLGLGAEPERVVVELFTREGCSHCAEAEKFLEALHSERPGLDVVERDVGRDPAALERLRELASERGVATPGVPAFHVAGELIVGYLGAGVTGKRLKALVERGATTPSEGTPEGACLPEAAAPCEDATVEIPVIGWRLSMSRIGFPLFTFALGLVDGFNPCSMWVLVLMLSILAGFGNRARMIAIAGTFVAVEGIAYFAFMAAWLNVFLLIGLSRASEIVLGAVAFAAGMVHIKDFWALGRGISLSIPQAAKPGIYARLRRVLVAESMVGALVGTIVLGLLVQVVELLCTSGFPALYTRILTAKGLSVAGHYAYLLLYDAAYMLDDVLVLGIGVVTLSRRRLQEREGRWLNLVSGLVMVGLGVYLIAAPWWSGR